MTDHSFVHAAGVLAAAWLVDATVGEYPRRLHPVVWMGRTVSWLERRAPRPGRPLAQLAWGALVALAVPALFAGAAALLIRAVEPWSVAAFVLEALLLKAAFALRELGRAAGAVRAALEGGPLAGAREALRSLCSRDPTRLGEPELVAGAVESVAENASDSFIAPLLVYALFGVEATLAYRAVNTLDAMVGYHGRYEFLGKVPARLDDLLNWIPARVTALLLLGAGALDGRDVRRGLSVWMRDARRTESPNAGHPMAAMAGLLRVELTKTGHYRLGDPGAALLPARISEAWGVARIAAALGVLVAVALLGGRHVAG
jgi:adenosylcobinamide-phosphate synthase